MAIAQWDSLARSCIHGNANHSDNANQPILTASATMNFVRTVRYSRRFKAESFDATDGLALSAIGGTAAIDAVLCTRIGDPANNVGKEMGDSFSNFLL